LLSRLFGKEQTQNVACLLKFDDLPEPESLLILDPSVFPGSFSDLDRSILQDTLATVESFGILLDFEHRTVDWLLSYYLPHIPNIVNSFETIGHIAHMNLRGDEMLKAKYTIGAIILEVRPVSVFITLIRCF